MIVNQLQAENLFKYRTLQLTELPTRGVIAISGPNESGKTSIAEILCLAFFGRTSLLTPREVTKVIKWGEFSGSVTLRFTNGDGNSYTLVRHFDADGNQSARLCRSGEQTPLSTGAEAVTQAVAQLGGFTYERFIDSLYLAQRNTAAPQALRDTVKELAGVATLERLSAEFAREIDTAKEGLASLTPQLTAVEGQLAQLNIREERLADLSAQRQSLLDQVTKAGARTDRQQAARVTWQNANAQVREKVAQLAQTGVDASVDDWQSRAGQLREALGVMDNAARDGELEGVSPLTGELAAWLDDLHTRFTAFGQVRNLARSYRERLEQQLNATELAPVPPATAPHSLPAQQAVLTTRLNAQARARRRSLVGFWITLLLALAGGGVWWLLTFARESALAARLVETLGTEGLARPPLVLAIAAGLGIGCVLFLVRVVLLASRMTATRRELAQVEAQVAAARTEVRTLDTLGQSQLPAEVAALRRLQDPETSAAAEAFASGPGVALLTGEGLAAQLATLQRGAAACEQHVRGHSERLDRQIRETTSTVEGLQQELRRREQEIAEEESRREKAAALHPQIRALQDKAREQRRRVAVRQVAGQLLDGMHHRLYMQFSLELRQVVSKVLPLLINGRYQLLQVDEQLRFQLLSSEKGGLIGVDEISGGTYHQIMLAIRLALAQALISASARSTQFVILDEPFTFVDEHHVRKTLEALPNLSEEIAQVWVTASRFDADTGFALHLRCAGDSDTLVAPGA